MTKEKEETTEKTEEELNKELAEELVKVCQTLFERQEPLGEPFESILYSNRWDLYA